MANFRESMIAKMDRAHGVPDKITPDPQDFEVVARDYPDAVDAERYRLAQANKIVRLYYGK